MNQIKLFNEFNQRKNCDHTAQLGSFFVTQTSGVHVHVHHIHTYVRTYRGVVLHAQIFESFHQPTRHIPCTANTERERGGGRKAEEERQRKRDKQGERERVSEGQ